MVSLCMGKSIRIIEPRHEISNKVVCAISKYSDQPEYSLTLELLTEQHFGISKLKKGGCTGSSESTHAKMPHCWKSHVAAQM